MLISPDFLASTYCREREVPRALERTLAGEAVLVPIILRKCSWQGDRRPLVRQLRLTRRALFPAATFRRSHFQTTQKVPGTQRGIASELENRAIKGRFIPTRFTLLVSISAVPEILARERSVTLGELRARREIDINEECTKELGDGARQCLVGGAY